MFSQASVCPRGGWGLPLERGLLPLERGDLPLEGGASAFGGKEVCIEGFSPPQPQPIERQPNKNIENIY